MEFSREFIRLACDKGVLRFGEFRTKAGRLSPYFFNAGLFDDGQSFGQLCEFYARAIIASKIECDVLFGPAYKGIPLVSLAAAALAEHYGVDAPFCFNRKEIKDHGEGGAIVGAPVHGRVLILDDVITAGTAIRETITLLQQAGGTPAGVVLALDRQERGSGELSATQEVEKNYGIPVTSIIRLDDLVEHLEGSSVHSQFLPLIQDYRERYGVS